MARVRGMEGAAPCVRRSADVELAGPAAVPSGRGGGSVGEGLQPVELGGLLEILTVEDVLNARLALLATGSLFKTFAREARPQHEASLTMRDCFAATKPMPEASFAISVKCFNSLCESVTVTATGVLNRTGQSSQERQKRVRLIKNPITKTGGSFKRIDRAGHPCAGFRDTCTEPDGDYGLWETQWRIGIGKLCDGACA